MRHLAWVGLVLSACYAPTLQPGAPCDPAANNCPLGQQCLPSAGGFVCGGGSGSAMDAPRDVDGPPNGDEDGDGVINATDNCERVANPDQHDEDGDQRGDVCDACPVSANNLDADADGVGDDCDPAPAVAGDAIVLFEGFASAVPAAWMASGANTWSVASDELVIVSSAGTTGNLRTDLVATSNMKVTTSVIIDQVFGSGAGIGIGNPFTPTYDGVTCTLWDPTLLPRELRLYDRTTATTVDTRDYAFTTGSRYTLALDRNGASYRCDVNTMGAAARNVQGSVPGMVQTPGVALRSDSVSARFQWLLVVTSP